MKTPSTTLSHLPKVPTKMEDDKVKVEDILKEVNLRIVDNSKPVFIRKLLSAETRMTLITLLTSYEHCFAWNYIEIPRFNKDLGEHYLSIKLGFRLLQRPPRHMALELVV